MPPLLELIVVLVVLGFLVVLGLGITRMSRAGGRGRGVGVGSVMTDLDAMLQPHHPTAAVLQQAKDGEEEHDDDGDDEEPGHARGARRHGTGEASPSDTPSRTPRPRGGLGTG